MHKQATHEGINEYNKTTVGSNHGHHILIMSTPLADASNRISAILMHPAPGAIQQAAA
jgi:hypothetical protein